MQVDEKTILDRLKAHFDHIYQLQNVYVFGWESDYFGVTKQTEYVYEVEVKISVADFRKDQEKEVKFRCFDFPDQEKIAIPSKEIIRHGFKNCESFKIPQGYCNLVYVRNKLPNRFYYIVPSEIVDKVKPLLPKFAGLLRMDEKGGFIHQVKAAPFIHKKPLLKDPIFMRAILDKYYYKYQNILNENRSLKMDLNVKKYYTEPDNYDEKQLTLI